MITITLAQLKSDITPMLKGTSLRQISDFYGTAAKAANRMLARISPAETTRTQTLSMPFYDNVQDYVAPTDIKQVIDIRPQANRNDQPGISHYQGTTPRQFLERLTPDSFSIRWNNGVRTLRAQRLPSGNVVTMDEFDGASSNGLWSSAGGISGSLYTETLNYVQGNAALGFDLSGNAGTAGITNSTAAALDLSSFRYQDASMLFVYIPLGTASRFTRFTLHRGSSGSAYKETIVTKKADGTAFTDGWNFLVFNWNTASTTGTPDDTKNTFREFFATFSSGATITGFLLDSWTDSLGELYEMEYYSEYLFTTAAGAWIQAPTLDTDLVIVSPTSYEILKTEMMVDITQIIRTGGERASELADWRLQLNGQPQSRYIKDPPYHGLYSDYLSMFPSSAILTTTRNYDFDL